VLILYFFFGGSFEAPGVSVKFALVSRKKMHKIMGLQTSAGLAIIPLEGPQWGRNRRRYGI
jgi:hypothetical protein